MEQLRPGHHCVIRKVRCKTTRYWLARCEGCGQSYTETRWCWAQHWVELHTRLVSEQAA